MRGSDERVIQKSEALFYLVATTLMWDLQMGIMWDLQIV